VGRRSKMLDQSLVRSGFDAEILLGERQLTYLVLSLIDAGRIPVTFAVGDPPVTLGLRGPETIDRTYEPHPDAPVLQTALDAMRPDGGLVNVDGVALWGRAVIDREVRPVAHAVIRDKQVQGSEPADAPPLPHPRRGGLP
jgi:hypothetical protein